MDTGKTIDMARLCIQITNTVSFSKHTHIQPLKKSKTKNDSNPKVLSDTKFRISQFWTTDLHCKIVFF